MSRRATVRGRPWRVRGGSSHGASSAHSASLRSVGYAFCLTMPPGYTKPKLIFQTGSEIVSKELDQGEAKADPPKHLLLVRGHWWFFPEPPEHKGWYIQPVIVPPVLYKDTYYFEANGPLVSLRRQAKKALEECTHLVFIGYS